jgi:hypothetical protein
VGSLNASCDPGEVHYIEQEIGKKPTNMGVGVIDTKTGKIRLFPFDETNTFTLANSYLQVQAGHEAAPAMAGIPPDQARGFILAKQANDWHVFNQSHLNTVDGQANTMWMQPQTYNEIVSALQAAGVNNPVVH